MYVYNMCVTICACMIMYACTYYYVLLIMLLFGSTTEKASATRITAVVSCKGLRSTSGAGDGFSDGDTRA